MFDKRKDNDPVKKDTEAVVGAGTLAATSLGSATELPNPTTPHTIRTTAVIGSTITIKGDITGEENLVIEGKVDGTVTLRTNDVTVGENGHVSADVSANVVRIDGEVKGDIEGVEKVVISKTGHVKGNIVAPRVTLEDGAKFKGCIDMDPSESKSTTPKADTAKPKSDVKPGGASEKSPGTPH